MIRAYVEHLVSGFTVGVSIVQHYEGDVASLPPNILRFTARDDGTVGHSSWEPIEPGQDIQPTFRLGHEEAVALMNALVARYSGVDDQRMLRADYDAERKRVDKLTDVVAGIAQTLAGAVD